MAAPEFDTLVLANGIDLDYNAVGIGTLSNLERIDLGKGDSNSVLTLTAAEVDAITDASNVADHRRERHPERGGCGEYRYHATDQRTALPTTSNTFGSTTLLIEDNTVQVVVRCAGAGESTRKGRRHGKGAIWLLSLGLPMFASAMPLDQAVRAGLAIREYDPRWRSGPRRHRGGDGQGVLPLRDDVGGPQEFDFGEIVYDLTASQMLYDWGRVTSKVDSASATQLSRRCWWRATTRRWISSRPTSTCSSERRVEVVREHIQRLDGIREMTQARDGDGYADRSELDRANLELSRAQEQLSLEKGNLQDARNQYAILVGREPPTWWSPSRCRCNAPGGQRYGAGDPPNRLCSARPWRTPMSPRPNEVREAKASLLRN